jgi:hypothetical protein
MTDRFKRGTAPGRARPAAQRPGSFKPGHKKLGGRKRGTPNVFPPDYQKAIFEAASRIGEDGNGKDAFDGYLMWVATRHPRIFYCDLFANLAANPAWDQPEEPRPTTEENSPSIAHLIGFTAKDLAKGRPVEVEPERPWAWTGQPDPVGPLMDLAIMKPRAFCRLLIAAFAPPRTRRRPAAPDESRHPIRRPHVQARTLSKHSPQR